MKPKIAWLWAVAAVAVLSAVLNAQEAKKPTLVLGNVVQSPGTPGEAGVVVPDMRRTFQVVRTTQAIEIDGKLDDAAWSKAPVLRDFTVSQMFNESSLPAPAADRTEARVLFNEEGIFVGVKAYQDPKTIYTKIRENGWLRPDLDWEKGEEPWANSGSDEIEVVIDPELTRCSYYVFHINPEGVKQKEYMPPVLPNGGLYKRVDPVGVKDDRWKAIARQDADGWTAEFFIPYESLGWQPIKTAGERDIYFDMVQDWTVMGFNINRVCHGRHQASSFSPSKGAQFFRDPANFGLACFRRQPCLIENVTFGNVFSGAGESQINFNLRSRSDKDQDLTVSLRVFGPGGLVAERANKVTLEAGMTAMPMPIFKRSSAGRHLVDLRVLDGKGETLFDRARYVFDIPEPVQMVLPRSILYQGEADFWAEVKVITPEAKVETIHYQLLRDKPVDKTKAASGVETEVVASGATGALEGGNFSVPFELSELAPGQYRFTVEAVQGGKPLGSASAPLEVIEDAFATKVHGTAGKGTGKPPETPPAAFALLATGLGAGKSEIGKEIPYLTDDMKSMPLLVWPDTASADFRSGATPRKAQLAAPIRAFAAGDEYEPVSFVVRAMRDLKTLRVEATELKGAAGAIPASQMDLRAEDPSTLLVKQESLGELPKDCVRRYFLTVYVAPGTPAGLYEGTLKFTAEGDVAEERPYSLLVLPIQLKDSSLHMGMCGEWTTGKDAERTMVQIRDALAHGMDGVECGHVFRSSLAAKANVQHIIWGLSKPTEEDSLGTGPERFKRAELDDEAFRMLKDSGMRPPIVVDLNPVVRYLPCTDENAELFEDFVRRIEAKRKEQGLPEFIYQLVDEPNDHFSMDDGRGGRRYGVALFDFFARVLHKVGVRTFITSNSGARGFDLCEGIRGQVDVWCTKVIDDPAEISRWTTDGKELWLYGYSGDGKCKGRMRSTYGFFAERVKASGVTTPAQAEMNAWNDQEKKNLNMASWEAIREGIDDSRYIAALKEAIKTAKTQAGPKAALAEQAQADLDAIVNAYPITPWQKIAFEKKHDADQWNKWRWIVASWIVKLQE